MAPLRVVTGWRAPTTASVEWVGADERRLRHGWPCCSSPRFSAASLVEGLSWPRGGGGFAGAMACGNGWCHRMPALIGEVLEGRRLARISTPGGTTQCATPVGSVAGSVRSAARLGVRARAAPWNALHPSGATSQRSNRCNSSCSLAHRWRPESGLGGLLQPTSLASSAAVKGGELVDCGPAIEE